MCVFLLRHLSSVYVTPGNDHMQLDLAMAVAVISRTYVRMVCVVPGNASMYVRIGLNALNGCMLYVVRTYVCQVPQQQPLVKS